MEGVLIFLGASAGGFLGWLLFSRKKVLSMREWMEIYWAGFNGGIRAAAGLVDDLGIDETIKPTAVRWAGQIRKLENNNFVAEK